MTGRIEHLAEGVTLMLGDCRDLLPTLPRIDVVITDPPYGMAFRSNHRTIRHEAIVHDDDDELLRWACGIEAHHSKYVFCRWDNLAACPKPKSMVTWVKNNWSMGDLEREHARQTEVCLFYPGAAHSFPSGRPTDVIHAPRTGNEHHPTEKPVALMKIVCGWTEGGVVDPFMGSGTTGVAAIQLGRPFLGIEIHEPYFDIACRRIDEALRSPDMFIVREKPIKVEQMSLLDK